MRHSVHHTPFLSHACPYVFLAQTHVTLPPLWALIEEFLLTKGF